MQEKTSQRFEFLDGLRGIAALGIIFFHFNGTLKDHGVMVMPHLLDSLCEWGRYGVQIFFVLSGFVIAYSLRNANISSFFCLRFFLKRSVRLDPPYWAIVGLMLTLNFLGHFFFDKKSDPLATPSQILINLLYLPDLLQISRILPVAWTLCIEIQFYMTFVGLLQIHQSLLNKFYPNRTLTFDQTIVSHALFGSLMLLSILQNTSWALLPPIPGLFIPYWYSFFMGCWVCWASLSLIRASWLWVFFVFLGSYGFIQNNSDALATLGVAFTIYGVSVLGGMHRIFTSWFFQYTGKISYSLYLIHWPMGMKIIDINLRFFGSEIHHFWSVSILLIVSFAGTLLAAHCFYYLIEFPSLNLSRKLKIQFLEKKLKNS